MELIMTKLSSYRQRYKYYFENELNILFFFSEIIWCICDLYYLFLDLNSIFNNKNIIII